MLERNWAFLSQFQGKHQLCTSSGPWIILSFHSSNYAISWLNLFSLLLSTSLYNTVRSLSSALRFIGSGQICNCRQYIVAPVNYRGLKNLNTVQENVRKRALLRLSRMVYNPNFLQDNIGMRELSRPTGQHTSAIFGDPLSIEMRYLSQEYLFIPNRNTGWAISHLTKSIAIVSIN